MTFLILSQETSSNRWRAASTISLITLAVLEVPAAVIMDILPYSRGWHVPQKHLLTFSWLHKVIQPKMILLERSNQG
jgi:hypothetical protein